MYFILDSRNINQVEVSEPSLQSNTGGGKTEVSTEPELYDIGQISSSKNASNLSDHQKYLIFLNKHFHPLKYPQKVLHICNRGCKSDYPSDNFVYSKIKDEVHCIYCELFLTEEKRKSLKSFVNVGYSRWQNIIEEENKHVETTVVGNSEYGRRPQMSRQMARVGLK